MAKTRLFIFDWDGTLMDSERQIVCCMQLAAQDVGLVAPAHDVVRVIIGLGLPEAIQRLFPQQPAARREQLRQAYARRFVAAAGGRSEMFAGARELLQGLRQRGHLLAVATGKSRAGLDRVLRDTGLTNFFDATRCADETASKPQPRMLQELLAELQVAPEEAVMIGDTSFDLEMAAALAMPRVAVAHGVHAASELAKYGPLAIVADIPALTACLYGLA